MSEKTIYTCDLCKKESTDSFPKGLLNFELHLSALVYHRSNNYTSHSGHVCHSCLDTISKELDQKFVEIINKLSND